MPRIANPYFAGPPATQPQTFFGRHDVLRFVDDTLAAPMHNAIVFYGQRRIGKTSILHQIARRAGQDYQAVFFDLQSSVDSQDLLYSLAREIAGQLKMPAPKRVDFQQDSEFFRTVYLPHVYQHLGDKHLLLLLDEFDALSLDPVLTDLDALPFVQALNRIIQSDDKRTVFLFVVGRRLKDLSAHQLQIFRGALDRQIMLFKKEDALQLITQPAHGILTYQAAAVERIWSLTGGHPYYTQLLCHKIFNEAHHQDIATITATHVETVIDEAISAGQTALQWFWNEVPLVERFALYTIGQLATENQGATLEHLLAQRDARRVQVPDIELKALPDKLVDRQVLRRDHAGRYRFAVEIVRRWIVQNHSLEEVSSELTRAAVDESAKAFFRAGLMAYRGDDITFATESFSRALSINPDYVEARLWLARTRLKANRLLAAIDEFVYVERFGGREAKEARVGLADARAQYGLQLEAEGKIEDAKQEYQRVLKLDEQHALANTRLGEIVCNEADKCLENEGVAAARHLYEQAIKYSRDNELQRKIKNHLAQYSHGQEMAYNWAEAEQVRQLASQIFEAEDDQQALVRTRLEWGQWLLSRHLLEDVAWVYDRLINEAVGESPRPMIENDILRYSQQEEEAANWPRVEAALKLLLNLFPDDEENQNRLVDSLCRQGDFYLGRHDLVPARAAYTQALTVTSSPQATTNLILEGFQAYYRKLQLDNALPSRKLAVEAMLLAVEILSQDNVSAYQGLTTALEELGDAFYAQDELDESHQSYTYVLENTTRLLQFETEASQTAWLDHTYRQRAIIGLKLGQVQLDKGAFNEAAASVRQALADARSDPHTVNQIKITLNNYRRRQEEIVRWNHAEAAMKILARLFPGDEEVIFWLAETRIAQAEWNLRRAIPDVETACRLAQETIEVSLPFKQRHLITTQLKNSFLFFCEQQEKASPPRWPQAEGALNSLITMFSGEVDLDRQLAELRARQGDWHLAQAAQTPTQAHIHLTKAAEAYRRALSDFHDDSLVTRLKDGFRHYQTEHSLNAAQSGPAIRILTEVLPGDPEIQAWQLAQTKQKERPPLKWTTVWRWGAVMVFVILVALVGFWGGYLGAPPATLTVTATITSLPTATITNTPTPTPVPTDTPVIVVVTTPSPLATPTISPTLTSIPVTPVPSPTPTPTLTPTLTPVPISLQLTFPPTDYTFQGSESLPRLEWASNAPETRRYQVRLTFEGQHPPYVSEPLTSTTWVAPVEVFFKTNLLPSQPEAQRITWQVILLDDNNGPVTSESGLFIWQPIPLPKDESLDMDILPDNRFELLVVLKNKGIYKSNNGGLDWQLVLTDTEKTLSTLHISPANPNIIYAGSYGHVWRSEDRGLHWSEPLSIKVNNQPHKASVNAITTDIKNADVIFVATGQIGEEDRGVLRSSDGGRAWQALNQENGLNKPFYTIVTIGGRVYTAGDGNQIYWRGVEDLNPHWEEIICSSCVPPVFTLAADPQNNDKLMAGSDGGAFVLSEDEGQTWRRMPSAILRAKVSVLAIDPLDTQTIYAGTGAYHYQPSDGEGFYRSDDGGITWEPLNTWHQAGGKGTYIQGVALDPANSNIVYIAGSEGIFCSHDRGNTWILLSARP